MAFVFFPCCTVIHKCDVEEIQVKKKKMNVTLSCNEYISLYSVRMRENADQKNSEFRHFSRRVRFILSVNILPFLSESSLPLEGNLSNRTVFMKDLVFQYLNHEWQCTLYVIYCYFLDLD